jgi:hypothetical protein
MEWVGGGRVGRGPCASASHVWWGARGRWR